MTTTFTKCEILRRACHVAGNKSWAWRRDLGEYTRESIVFATPSSEERAAEQILHPRCREVVGILAHAGFEPINDAAQAWLRETENAAYEATRAGEGTSDGS